MRAQPINSECRGRADGLKHKEEITMKFDSSKYYRVGRYGNNGFHETIETGFRCKIIAKHCEYDEFSGLWVNHHLDCAYEIEEYHRR